MSSSQSFDALLSVAGDQTMKTITAIYTPALRRIWMVVLLIGAANGCGGSPTQPNWDGQVRVSGTIRDFQTNTPIGGAQVTMGTVTGTADPSGIYSLTVPAGEQQVSIDGESIGIVNMKDPTYRGDLLAHATGCIARYGTVVDSQTRRPVSGAVVSTSPVSVTTATDSSGWFRLDLGCPAVTCLGFNTTFLSVTNPSYVNGSFPAGLGICRVQRVDYELTLR